MSKKLAGKRSSARKSEGFNLLLIPLIIIIAVVPLVVRVKHYETGLEDYSFFSYQDKVYDFFLYYKAQLFIIASVVIACILIVKLVLEGKKIQFCKIFIPLGAYGLLALLSSIFSEHSRFSFSGIYEQFESVFVLLGYCLVAYYAFLVVQTDDDVRTLVRFLTAGVVVMLAIGFTQAFTTDFYQTDLAKHLILTKEYLADNGELQFNFGKGRVYMSLYNPNYVGSYVALLSPVFLMLIFSARRLIGIFIYSAVYLGLLLSLYGSESRAGFAGIAMSIVVLAVVYNKRILRYWMPALCVLSLLITTFLTMDNLMDGRLIGKIQSIFSPQKQTFNLTKIETNDENIVIHYKGEQLAVSFDYVQESGDCFISAYDGEGGAVDTALSEDGSYYQVSDERFAGFTISPVYFSDTLVGFGVKIDGKDWYFTNQLGDSSYYYFNIYGKFTKIQSSPTVKWLAERGSYISGRGFIWSKTVPLLKDNIILGSGADTFMFEYPNEDYVDAHNNGYGAQIMTKPHNMYLQTGVQTGVLSLICFLAFYLIYFIWSLRIYVRDIKSPTANIGIGILAGTFGYMVVGMINDSTITVAPLYWALIGVGIAINMMVQRELKDAQAQRTA